VPEAEEVVRIAPCPDAYQKLEVGHVVGAYPVLQVRIWEVSVPAPGVPWMRRRPPAHQPASGGRRLGRRLVGTSDGRVLEQEKLVAMGEGGGVNGHAVVGAAPQREVQREIGLEPCLMQVLHQRRDSPWGQ
jgi:hypothetical protein